MDINLEVNKLNRLFKLYVNSTNGGIRPYRVSKIKRYLENLILRAKDKFEVITLDTSNAGDYFLELKDQLNLLSEKKREAINLKNYEEAGAINDKGKRIMKNYLIKSGIPSNVFFFHHDNKIFSA